MKWFKCSDGKFINPSFVRSFKIERCEWDSYILRFNQFNNCSDLVIFDYRDMGYPPIQLKNRDEFPEAEKKTEKICKDAAEQELNRFIEFTKNINCTVE